MIEDPREVRELMDLGASAYIVKSASAEHLVAAVRAAIVNRKSQRNVVVGMPRALLEVAEEGSHGVLSARELEILLLAARGLSNRQIGASLHVAVGTVKRHLANAYQKMGVGSRVQATRMALHEEWITIQDVTDDLGETEGE
jgi:DNA-binding NarL/FixJ family response regulator